MITRIVMRSDGVATAEGPTEIFGTSGRQTVSVLDGASVTFRSGFNSGGDVIRLNGRPTDFTVSINGSNVTLTSAVDNITVVIPIGTVANSIVFDGGDARSLSLVNGVPMLGNQAIPGAGAQPAIVAAGPSAFSITGAASVSEGGTITYTVTRTNTALAETLLFSVEGTTNDGVVAAATQGADFIPASGVIAFAAGAATATFTITVAKDNLVEGLEGISVRVLSGNTVVAQSSAIISDGTGQGQIFALSAGNDNIFGTIENDTITGRISEFSSNDAVAGGAGSDTLVLTGMLPTDTQFQPAAVLDAAFERTTGIERLVLTGGTAAQPVNATLGQFARAAGLQEVVANGAADQGQIIDVRAFNGALTVTGSDKAEIVKIDLTVAGAKTLNLGAGNDTMILSAAGQAGINVGSLNGGDGIDTIQTSSSIAAQLTNSSTFTSNTSGFEWLSINQEVAQRDVIRADTLNVSRVISSGTLAAPAPTAETVALTFGGHATGADAVRFDGITTTFAEGDTALAQASKFVAAMGGIGGAGSSNWRVTAFASETGIITLTNKATGNVADLTGASFTFSDGVTVGVPTVSVAGPRVQGADAIPGVAEVAMLTFNAGSAYVVDTGEPALALGLLGEERIGGINSFELRGFDADGSAVTLTVSSRVNIGPNNQDVLANLVLEAARANAVWSNAYTTTVEGGVVTFTARTIGPRGNITLVDNGNDGALLGIVNLIPIVDGVIRNETFDGEVRSGSAPVDAVREVFTASFSGIASGRDAVQFDGVTVRLDHNQSSIANAAKFAMEYNAATNRTWNAVANGDGTITFTSIVAGARNDVRTSDFVIVDDTGIGIPTVSIVDIKQGSADGPGEIVVQNLASNGTLELTGAGNHTVNILGADVNSADVVNIVLTNRTAADINYGRVTALNVEQVNLNLNDAGGTANPEATREIVEFNIAQATSLFVTGAGGAVIIHNAASLNLFDATGIQGSVDDDLNALGVLFDSKNDTVGASVIIRGGIGNDLLGGGRANDNFDLTSGGSDIVQLAANSSMNGSDTIKGFTGGTFANSNFDRLDLNSAFVIDGNGAEPGLIFNATPTNTSGDLTLAGNNSVVLVTDGAAVLNASNIKAATASTGQNGEILVSDRSSAYVLHATSAGSSKFTIYRIFDGDPTSGINVQMEVLGVVEMTNSFGDLTHDNFIQALPGQVPPTSASMSDAPIGAPSINRMEMMSDSFLFA